ncbi:hypothetical protein HMPREF9713_02246 [Myroides odoratimimus CCUG 12700]|uniref:Uncharacterized protein n=1 Tax=Myroides odoratimimus CIP 101113 TaxID=883154 RepID=A0AAV3F8I1_9FLAO|nr:hypothetical protein HMPREF9715_00189 [Myroides odoratimimus CIP 101113]EPH11119.1 hypothetical protein HMPREF9713_02246 [Myroides odoratimimus CCUG 12700]SHK90244.1 hypothetical protein SAMN05444275_101187 [Myroides odoratimimus subsp. xuanwuensis]
MPSKSLFRPPQSTKSAIVKVAMKLCELNFLLKQPNLNSSVLI